LEVVDRRSLAIRGAERVDDDLDAFDLVLVVALLGAAVEAEAVREPGAAAALDRDPENRDVGLRRHAPTDLLRGGGGERYEAVGALLELHGPHRTSGGPVQTTL